MQAERNRNQNKMFHHSNILATQVFKVSILHCRHASQMASKSSNGNTQYCADSDTRIQDLDEQYKDQSAFISVNQCKPHVCSCI
jgi:hypothetical protein